MYIFIYSIYWLIKKKKLNDQNNYYNHINHLIVEFFFF